VIAKKLRPVERCVKGWPKKSEAIVKKERGNEPNYSHLMNLTPQELRSISPAFRPLSHRLLAANPQANPQIFRAFSASFAHGVVRLFFRSVCAAISQELANSAGEKKGEKQAKRAPLRKTVRSSRFAVRRGCFPLPPPGRRFTTKGTEGTKKNLWFFL
jgi:hypothetical protein